MDCIIAVFILYMLKTRYGRMVFLMTRYGRMDKVWWNGSDKVWEDGNILFNGKAWQNAIYGIQYC